MNLQWKQPYFNIYGCLLWLCNEGLDTAAESEKKTQQILTIKQLEQESIYSFSYLIVYKLYCIANYIFNWWTHQLNT